MHAAPLLLLTLHSWATGGSGEAWLGWAGLGGLLYVDLPTCSCSLFVFHLFGGEEGKGKGREGGFGKEFELGMPGLGDERLVGG